MAVTIGDPVPVGEVKAGDENVAFTMLPVLLEGEEIGRIIQMGKHLFNWAASEEVTAKRGLQLCPLSGWTRQSVIDTLDSMVERQLRRLNAGLKLWPTDTNPLDPELQGWVDTSSFGECLRHPLVYAIPYTHLLAPSYNAKLKALKAETAEALAKGNFERYIWMHERPYRLQAFLEVMGANELADERYWELVANFWIDCENIYQNFGDWLRLWTNTRAGRECAMTEEERNEHAELPEVMTVYRGYRYKASMRGLSWTLDRERAVWFARRFDALTKLPPRLATAEVRRENVLAYFDRRNEDEVVVLPKHLLNLRSENLPKHKA